MHVLAVDKQKNKIWVSLKDSLFKESEKDENISEGEMGIEEAEGVERLLKAETSQKRKREETVEEGERKKKKKKEKKDEDVSSDEELANTIITTLEKHRISKEKEPPLEKIPKQTSNNKYRNPIQDTNRDQNRNRNHPKNPKNPKNPNRGFQQILLSWIGAISIFPRSIKKVRKMRKWKISMKTEKKKKPLGKVRENWKNCQRSISTLRMNQKRQTITKKYYWDRVIVVTCGYSTWPTGWDYSC